MIVIFMISFILGIGIIGIALLFLFDCVKEKNKKLLLWVVKQIIITTVAILGVWNITYLIFEKISEILF